MRTAGLVCAAAVAQITLGRWSATPWFVPDLTTLTMAVMILRVPERWVIPAGAAAVAASALAVDHAVWIGSAYLLAGGLAAWMARQWNVSQPATERFIVVVCQTALTGLVLATIPLRFEILVLAVGQIAITLLCLPVVQAIANRVVEVRP